MVNDEISAPVLIKELGMMFPSETSKQKRRYGLYKCYCGVEFKAQQRTVKSGKCMSCGCYRKKQVAKAQTTHGFTNHPIYDIWQKMSYRCNNENQEYYNHYGGRGIKVCDRWSDVANFIKDMYPSYKKGLSLDRIDNDGNYSPENCRWVGQSTQTRNTKIIRSSNTSGYRGVSRCSDMVYRAQIGINGKTKYLGRFSTALEAAKAYDSYVIANSLEHTINGVL